MKFQKSLLAAALAFVGFSANAAQTLSDAWLYQNAAGDQLIKLNLNQGNGVIGSDVFYKENADGTLTEVGTELPEGYNLLIGGQIETNFTQTPPVVGTPDEQHFGEYADWGYDSVTTSTTGVTDLTLNGQLVDPTGEVLAEISGSVTEGGVTTTNAYGSYLAAGYIDRVSDKPVYGIWAQEYQQANNQNTYVTGNGILLTSNEGEGSIIDYVNGTHTKNTVTAGTVNPADRKEIRSYLTETGDQVIEIIGEGFYKSDVNGVLTLTDLTAEDLNQIATGVADFSKGGTTTSSIETKRVNQTAVTYGESVTTRNNAEGVIVGSTDPNWTFDEGTTFIKPGADSVVSTTSKEVVTGIIASGTEGNTYGLQATNSKDGAVTAQTTITAEGINTTGVINAADYQIGGVSIVDNIKAEVGTAVGGATAAIDAKIAEVDTRLTQFNSTAARLNSRIDDVEQTAYRGVAIALAAQQQIPNIGAGQFAVFGGVGHYEGETAGALGVASVFADGRTSLSAALGFAGGNEVGGRVGVSYVFGGK